MMSRLINIVFLVFLSRQFSVDTNTHNVVDAAYFDFTQTHVIDSCKDYGIESRETLALLDEDCTAFCGHDSMESFDWADIEEDPNYIIRNTVCRCFEYGQSPEAPKIQTFECWSKAEVWDKSKPVMKCEEDFGIVSPTTCQDYCKRIDPQAVAFQGFKGQSKCECGGFPVCSDIALSAFSSGASATAVSTALALVMGCILALF